MGTHRTASTIVFLETRRPDDPRPFLAAHRSLQLAGRPTPQRSTPPPGTPWAAIVVLPLLLAIMGMTVGLGTMASRYSAVVPGPVYAVDEGSELLMTSVRVRKASAFDLIRSWLGDKSLLKPKEGVGLLSDGRGREAYIAAQRDAWLAAHRCLGVHPDEGSAPGPPKREVSGGSAGLMMALSEVASLRGRSLSPVQAAGTGTIDPWGMVGGVDGVGLKARAADASGASLFFVPHAQMDEARREAPALPVVGVGTLDDALRHLGDPGCRG